MTITLKRAAISGLAAAALAAGGLITTAGSASAAPTCTSWQDSNTYGVQCQTSAAYYASVKCSNGKHATGVTTNSNRWSYAYCTSYGRSVHILPGAYGRPVFP